MSGHDVEFPKLTPQARTALDAALNAITSTAITISLGDLRRALAASLREAMEQADPLGIPSPTLEAIANNLHNLSRPSLPPPPPTLAEARTADLDTPAGKSTVTAFLATLGEGTQP